MGELYDAIGGDYRRFRRPDPRIAAALHRALGDASSGVNVGAGTGSSEPTDRRVVAVEPSRTMIRRAGRRRAVILTWDPACPGFWLTDYFPEILDVDRRIFPPIDELRRSLGIVAVFDLPIPHDCRDGFLGAHWRRPRAYLDPAVRSAISTFSKLADVAPACSRLPIWPPGSGGDATAASCRTTPSIWGIESSSPHRPAVMVRGPSPAAPLCAYPRRDRPRRRLSHCAPLSDRGWLGMDSSLTPGSRLSTRFELPGRPPWV